MLTMEVIIHCQHKVKLYKIVNVYELEFTTDVDGLKLVNAELNG